MLARWVIGLMNLLLRNMMIAKPAKRSTNVRTTIPFTAPRTSCSTFPRETPNFSDPHLFLHEPELLVDQVVDDRDGQRLAEEPALLFHRRVADALFPFDGQKAENAHHDDDRARRDQDELELKTLSRK